MAISLRLSKQLEKRLEVASQLAGVSKSEYVRRCLEKELEAEETDRQPMNLPRI
jgi:predicted DNA-binding protein